MRNRHHNTLLSPTTGIRRPTTITRLLIRTRRIKRIKQRIIRRINLRALLQRKQLHAAFPQVLETAIVALLDDLDGILQQLVLLLGEGRPMAVAVLGETSEDNGGDVAKVDWFVYLVSHVGGGEEGVGGGIGEDVELREFLREAFGWGGFGEVGGGFASKGGGCECYKGEEVEFHRVSEWCFWWFGSGCWMWDVDA